MDLRDAVTLITGGASGLGAATAAEFARAGARVAILDLPSAADAARSSAPDALFVAGDVTSPDDVANAVHSLFARFGALHVLVSCAGILRAQRVLSQRGPHSLDLFAQVIQVNLVGTFNVLRIAAAKMAANAPNADGERGVIINTASTAAFEGQVGQAAYAASKGGVAAMTLPISRELGSHGIRVCAIAPGTFETPMLAGAPEAVRAALAAETPFPPRMGRPPEFAALARHVAENPMLNGAVIRLDGGLRMSAR